jgi:aarF domain-containing kinase
MLILFYFSSVATKILEYINPSLSRLSLSAIVGDIRSSMLEELDFTLEAKNLVGFRNFLAAKGIVDATAPMPYPSASGKRVLTMEYLHGVPLVDLEGIRKYSRNPEATLIAALGTWASSVVENDFFHADVHAGNLLVLEDGRVGFIDFGIVGRISDKVWFGIGDLVKSFATEDFVGVADAMVQIGATNEKIDVEKFANDLKDVFSKISTMQANVVIQASTSGDILNAQLNVDERETTEVVLQIVSVAENNGLKLPREFGLLLKQALYFDRYQKLLAPSLDPLRDTRVREAMAENASSGPYNGGSRPRGGASATVVIDTDAVEK